MTNDNTTRKKANAVFFAAVMVISMVAAGFAVAPAAAVTDSDLTVNNFSPQEVDESTTETHNLDVTIQSISDASGHSYEVVLPAGNFNSTAVDSINSVTNGSGVDVTSR